MFGIIPTTFNSEVKVEKIEKMLGITPSSTMSKGYGKRREHDIDEILGVSMVFSFQNSSETIML